MSSSHTHIDRAYELMRLERYDLALAEVQRALEAAPESAEPHICAAWVLWAAKRLPEAETAARAALHADPTDAEGFHALASVQRALGRLAEADEAYQAALRLNNGDRTLQLTNYTRLLIDLGRLPEALARVEEALQLAPNWAIAHEVRGRVLHHMNRLPEAAAAYRAALQSDPRNVAAHNLLGTVELAAGQADAAVEHFRAALRLNPGEREAQQNLVAALKARTWVYRQATRAARWWRAGGARLALYVVLLVPVAFVALVWLLNSGLVSPAVGALLLALWGDAVVVLIAATICALVCYVMANGILNALLMLNPQERALLPSYDWADAAIVLGGGVLIGAVLVAASRALVAHTGFAFIATAGAICLASSVPIFVAWTLRTKQGLTRLFLWFVYAAALICVAVLTLIGMFGSLAQSTLAPFCTVILLVSFLVCFMFNNQQPPGAGVRGQ